MNSFGLHPHQAAKLFAILICVLVLSGCEGLREFQQAVNGAGTHTVLVPTYEPSAGLKETKLPRIKVSTLTVKSTDAGKVFMRKSAARISYGYRTNFYAEYILDKGFGASVRDVMGQIFELDPSAGQTASVAAAVSISAAADGNWWCKYWDTWTRVEFDITITPQAGETVSQNFNKSISETFCAVQFLFPSVSALNANFETAFNEVSSQAIDYFRLRKRATADKPGS
ncbi:MAG: hypothetical protein CMM77_05805 [Rhodospirillaceae bacterium]|mgnify:CR=1 FL=1|nr:hypothetical protein [Magnetovibrio sp.]MAY66623.1 hypothetical protein [Rhodospirillaceae bacterium]|tara:strand:+ start:59 stop:739 length:681 start_codon:yes stop_codon:yes gene_type:complete